MRYNMLITIVIYLNMDRRVRLTPPVNYVRLGQPQRGLLRLFVVGRDLADLKRDAF